MPTWLARLLGRGRVPATQERQGYMADETDTWRAAFEEARFLSEAPRRLQEAQSQMVNHLGRAYQAHERLGRRYATLLQGIMQAVDLCEGLQPDESAGGDQEGLAAIRRALVELLADHGILRWTCQPGEPVREGCEIVGIEERGDLPENTIASVVAPGYRRPNGEVLRRAQVTVSRAPAPTPAPPPGEAAPTNAPEETPAEAMAPEADTGEQREQAET